MDAVERLSLEQASASTLLALTHVHRYELAAELCAGLRVLDLCCGSGYGTEILAREAGSVTAVDRDRATIERARERFAGQARAEFVCADAHEYLDRQPGEFEAIVLLEGLEHLPEPERALDRLAAHAAAGALLVVSIPNSGAFDEVNPHHRVDFDFESAMAAFERLPGARVLYQFHAEGSLIGPGAEGEAEGRVTLAERAEPQAANHFIALVNAERSPAGERAATRMQLAAAPAFNSYMLDLERANRRLWRTNQQLARERLGVADSAAATRIRGAERRELARPLEALAALGVRIARPLATIVLTILPHGLTIVLLRVRERLRQDPPA